MDDTLQFTSNKHSWEQFFALNSLKPSFFSQRMQLLNHIDCGGVIRANTGDEVCISMSVPDTLHVTSSFKGPNETADGRFSMCTATRSEKPGFLVISVLLRAACVGICKLSAFARPSGKASGVESSQVFYFTVQVTASGLVDTNAVPGFPLVYTQDVMSECSLVSPLRSPLSPRTTEEFAIEDLSPDAQDRKLNLCLWVGGKPGSDLVRKVKEGRVTYSVRKHLTEVGNVNLAERKGHSFGFLAKWDVQ